MNSQKGQLRGRTDVQVSRLIIVPRNTMAVYRPVQWVRTYEGKNQQFLV